MSKAYYWYLKLLPKRMRDDAYKLYSFIWTVREAAQPEQHDTFERLEHRWGTIKVELGRQLVPTPLDNSASEHVLANIAYLTHRYGFDHAWIDAFFQSMRWDVRKHGYRSLKDLQLYMYGSAEVVALMLAKIVGLPEKSWKAARLQGRAMQYIAFLRDIPKDHERGQNYFPANDIKKYGLKNLSETEARAKPGMFADFMHAELLRYAQWQTEANDGFAHIPRRFRVSLQTVVDSQTWVAQRLKNDPYAVYTQKLQPSKRRTFSHAVRHGMGR